MKLDYNKIVSQVTDKLDLSDEEDLKKYKKKKMVVELVLELQLSKYIYFHIQDKQVKVMQEKQLIGI